MNNKRTWLIAENTSQAPTKPPTCPNPGVDREVTNFFSEVNEINTIIDQRKSELEKLIEDSQKQLKFLDELKATPDWINSYLLQESDLRSKITKVLENNPEAAQLDASESNSKICNSLDSGIID